MDTDRITRVPRRFGLAIIGFSGDSVKHKSEWPCGNGMFIFRKHLWKGKTCRRCGEGIKENV